jgi:hypothetical protein
VDKKEDQAVSPRKEGWRLPRKAKKAEGLLLKKRRPAVLSGRLAFFLFYCHRGCVALKESGSAALCVLWQKPRNLLAA